MPGFPGSSVVKNPPVKQETQIPFLGRKDTLEREMPPHSIFLPGAFHGQRGLAGYSPGGHKESNMTEQLKNNNISSAHLYAHLQVFLYSDDRGGINDSTFIYRFNTKS